MDNRPIGFFDSGLGGLTCIKPLMRRLPEEKMIYFGDTARTPYGSKATDTIKKFSSEIADFLVSKNVKMIVIACNTVSATCVDDLKKRFKDIPIVGIIEPAARRVAEICDSSSNVGIIGTKVTIASGEYKKLIKNFNPDISIYQTPCPAYVPLIEEGIIANDIMDLTIKYYMDDFIRENSIDKVVLGCTHYPLIQKNIQRIYPDIEIINPSDIVVDTIDEILTAKDAHAINSDVQNVFYASDLSENFVNMIDNIFRNEDEEAKVKFKSFDRDNA